MTHALLGSYMVQAQHGDWAEESGPGTEYLEGFRFAPVHSAELLAKIAQLHKNHK